MKKENLDRMKRPLEALDRLLRSNLSSNPPGNPSAAVASPVISAERENQVKLIRKLKAKPYRGFDPEFVEHVAADPGEVVEVSQEKADQVLKDFPKDWEKEGTKGFTDEVKAVKDAEEVAAKAEEEASAKKAIAKKKK
jgi:hypothetical protein